ncbi:MAG: hypothetical protein LBV23_10250 [Deltaproteobacteria bacterium]|nr:hypothetical protein [Deltaproteobacteria bacterium]
MTTDCNLIRIQEEKLISAMIAEGDRKVEAAVKEAKNTYSIAHFVLILVSGVGLYRRPYPSLYLRLLHRPLS